MNSDDERSPFSHKKDESKVGKLVFRSLGLDMDKKVKKVSDPPPRPLPSKLNDENKRVSEWSPDASEKLIKGEQLVETFNKVGQVAKWVGFGTVVVGSLIGLGWVFLWVMKQYNFG